MERRPVKIIHDMAYNKNEQKKSDRIVFDS
jgi:hypothetical protein